ncbi:MAG: response regulator transcription factor [Candidatus Levybacteria bacterium]|nr:response regulator transcription factor [Candidatus Levybacteria bacterium]
MTYKVLIVEDDNDLRDYLKELLLDNTFSVQVASNGAQALNLIQKFPPDLVILDLGLPNMSGETVLLEIRKKYPELRVIILTARDDVSDVIKGFSLGADDYMTKPFNTDELLARINARLRSKEGGNTKLKIADLELDNKRLEVKRGKKLIQLTPTEFKLLQYLMNNKEHILTREMILNRIWFYQEDIETRVVDVYMGYLRKKIDLGFKKKLIRSVRGFGYTIKE